MIQERKVNYSLFGRDKSNIPIRPDSSISVFEPNAKSSHLEEKSSLNDGTGVARRNKRESLSYLSTQQLQNNIHSRIPIAVSSNNIAAFVNNENIPSITGSKPHPVSLKRFSMIEGTHYRASADRMSSNSRKENTTASHNQRNNDAKLQRNLNNISRISELSINESRIPRSPSLGIVSSSKKSHYRHSAIVTFNSRPENKSYGGNIVKNTDNGNDKHISKIETTSRVSSSSNTRNKLSSMSVSSKRLSLAHCKSNMFNTTHTTDISNQVLVKKNNNPLKFRSSFTTKKSILEKTPTNNMDKQKIRSMKELLNFLETNIMTRSKLANRTVDHSSLPESKAYKFEELSSKRPDLFEKLSMFERISQHNRIFFTGIDKEGKIKADRKNFKSNYGFDDQNFNYRVVSGDHINYKYEVCSVLGKGAFGSVVSVIDHSFATEKVLFACKIISNNPKWLLQSVEEVKILKQLNHPNVLKYHEHFNFRSHMCIITEILGVSLYEAIQVNNYKGFSLPLVRRISKEILEGLKYIHSKNIIHCDLKPENIMLTKGGCVKIIDFGSSCFKGQLKYSYLQSRFYRSPEVLLGCRYDNKVDIWSVALIAIELYCGVPLLQPQNEWELFHNCINYFNIPSRQYILRSRSELKEDGPIGEALNNKGGSFQDNNQPTLLWKAFDKNGGIDYDYVNRKLRSANAKGTCPSSAKFQPGSQDLKSYIRKHACVHDSVAAQRAFTEFLQMCLVWNKWARSDAHECLYSEFFTGFTTSADNQSAESEL